MSSKIRIVCFDINSNKENENINLIESSLRIFDEFMEIHLFLESEKTEKKCSEIKYSFTFNISGENKLIYEIYVLQDINFIHNISLDADSYLIFINLENDNTLDIIEKIIKYIIESYCLKEIKIYLVGIYKDKIIPNLNKESIVNYFEEEKLNCEYYQIKYENNNNNDIIKHMCLYEDKNMKNNKKKSKLSKKKIKKNNLIDTIEIIMKQIYERKLINESRISNNPSFFIDKEKDINFSGNNCNMF